MSELPGGPLMADEQAVMDFIRADPEPTRMARMPQWDTWSEWVLAHPWAGQALFDGLVERGASHDQAIGAVGRWLRDSGRDAQWKVDRVESDAGAAHLLVRPAQGGGTIVPLVLGHHRTDEGLDGQGAVDAALRGAERHFLLCHPDAPVLVITYQEQEEAGVESRRAPGRHTWVGVDSLFSCPVSERDATLEPDTCESDSLRDDGASTEGVDDWEGMFYCQGELARPGPALVALRRKLAAERRGQRLEQTVPGEGASPRSGLRL